MNAVQGLGRQGGKSPSAADADPPLLDKAHINQLCVVLGATRVDALFVLLSKELESRPSVIRKAILAGDLSRARHESHSFKGATMSVGAMALGKAAAEIEHAADLQAMAAALPALDRQAERTLGALAALLPSHSSAQKPH